MENSEQKYKRRALVETSIIMLILLIAFIIFGFVTPLPLPEERGIVVNFGDTEMGGGDLNSQELEPVMEEVIEENQEVIPEETTSEEVAAEEVVTQEVDESIAIKEAEERKKQAEKQKKLDLQKEVERQQELENQRIEQERLDKERKEQEARDRVKAALGNAKGSGQGNTGGSGNQGSTTGDPNSSNTGPGGTAGSLGGGSGTGYDLAGRSVLKKASLKDDSQVEGKIIVKIWVDRNGNVTRAQAGEPGTTISNSTLRSKAEQSALKTKFSSKNDAPEVQIGRITFTFRLG